MMKHISYPSIEQFRTIVTNLNRQFTFIGLDDEGKGIYDPSIQKPTLTFTGTVKLHGTNAGVSFNPIDGMWAQSKENVITVTKDNAGFAFFVETNKDVFLSLIDKIIIRTGINPNTHNISIFGEWAGAGIQKKVGITNIPKSFFIFGVKISPLDNPNDSETVVDGVKSTAYWVDSSYLESPEHKIYNIENFKTFEVEVDFNRPDIAQNKFIELTMEVEEECPVAKEFGFSGLGEGIVFRTLYRDTYHRFKSKGEKHAASSKVKTLKVVDNERISRLLEVADKVTPAWRLEQMLEKTFDFMNGGLMDRTKLGEFLRNVINDVIKEESDVIAESGFEPKDINKQVSDVAKKYFFEQEKVKI